VRNEPASMRTNFMPRVLVKSFSALGANGGVARVALAEDGTAGILAGYEPGPVVAGDALSAGT
jgi:hypothetical protein